MPVHIGDLVEYRARGKASPAEVLGRTRKDRVRIARRDATGAIVVRAVKEENLQRRSGGVIDEARAA